MTDERSTTSRWRLSSSEGLIQAGIVESCYFSPMTGLMEVAYTENWARILRSSGKLISDPVFATAFLDDDPLAMRRFVEDEGSRLAAEAKSDKANAGTSRPGPGVGR